MDESKSYSYEDLEKSNRLQIFFKSIAWTCTLWEKYARGSRFRTKKRNFKLKKICQPISGFVCSPSWSARCNLATIDPILEIFYVLESPDHVLYIFDTFMR